MKKRKIKWISILMIVSILMSLNPITQVAANDNILMQTSLVAGQNETVGTVSVVKNAMGQLCVTYSLSEQARTNGWLIYETQLAVGKSLADIPQTRKTSNPIPGQFLYKHSFAAGTSEHTEYIDSTGLASGTTLFVSAHAVVKKGSAIVAAPYGGSRVFGYDQGVRYDGSGVILSRSDPNQALNFETGAYVSNFYSLGFEGPENDGWLIIEFDKPISNGPGNDLRVIEDTWGLPYPAETAEVSVSQDGINWVSLGLASNQTPISLYHTITEFEFDTVGLAYAKYVKLQDQSIMQEFAHLYLTQGATLDGYDVNAVLALHDYINTSTYDETAWGAGIRFTEQGNWGMYFTCIIP